MTDFQECQHQPCIRRDDDGYLFAQCSRCMLVTTACKSWQVAMEKFNAGKVFECHQFIGQPAAMVGTSLLREPIQLSAADDD